MRLYRALRPRLSTSHSSSTWRPATFASSEPSTPIVRSAKKSYTMSAAAMAEISAMRSVLLHVGP